MLKRIIYLHISISLLLLIPSIYGVLYCFTSEKMVSLAPPIENEIIKSINMIENKKVTCDFYKLSKKSEGRLTPKRIREIDYKIIDKCSEVSSAGFNDKVAAYTHFVLKFNSIYTNHIKKLEKSTYALLLFLDDTLGHEKELFCYLDDQELVHLQLTEKEIAGVLSSKEEDGAYYTKLLSERLKAEYGESLKAREAKAQENLKNHIAKLKEFLNTIRAARLAHEPYRPTIRFIGWFWLIFEIIGMILLLGKAGIELKAWSQRRKEKLELK